MLCRELLSVLTGERLPCPNMKNDGKLDLLFHKPLDSYFSYNGRGVVIQDVGGSIRKQIQCVNSGTSCDMPERTPASICDVTSYSIKL